MRWYSIDNRKRDSSERRGTLINRSFWLHGVPRVMPLCRLVGHKPIVDGTSTPARWVCCDRCGVRRSPQGGLDPDRWNIGDRFVDQDEYGLRERAPGPWPATPKGEIGGQLVVGKSYSGISAEVKIGNAGSEHTLAAHLKVSPFGALYLHTEGFGTWLQRRLNPVGYESRVIGISIHHGRAHWDLWAKRDSWSRTDPKWQQGSFRIDPRDILLGPARNSYEDIGEKVTTVVRMPHGDDHQVELQLQRCTHGRKHGHKQLSWSVDWTSRQGIPVRFDDGWKGGNIYGSGVKVSDAAVQAESWPYAAAAAIAEQMMRDRVRYGFRPALEDAGAEA